MNLLRCLYFYIITRTNTKKKNQLYESIDSYRFRNVFHGSLANRNSRWLRK